ncbi:MAG: protein BatD [Bacteroidaceae bacterium]|nr:protein BatD [Bacteroidaceae bacterium]
MKRLISTFTGLFIILAVAFADEISFVASAPNAVVVGQQFKLSYKVNRGNAKELHIPSIDGFTILMGPSRSSSSSYSNYNGQVTSTVSLTYTYILKAEKEGTFTLPAATTEVEGKQVKSNSVEIKVLPQDKHQAGSQTSAQSGGSGSSAEIGKNDLFMTAILNKTKIFEQEAVLLTYKVYSAVNLTSLNGKMPTLKEFHIQEIDLPQQKEWQLEHYNGRNYRALTWRQYLLFPQQSGEIEIPSVAFEGIVAQQVRTSMDPFDMFFNGGSQYVEVKKTLNTPALKLKVENLPSGKPEGFSGGVGEFNIKSSLSASEVKANEAVTMRITISGVGNMKLLKTPEVNFPADFEVYDPKVDNNFSVKSNGLSGNKIIEYLVIPRHAGTFTIPSVKFSYFDVKQQQYKILETEPYTLTVAKGKGSDSQVATGYVSKEDLKLLGKDIRFIKNGNTSYFSKENTFFASTAYMLCYLIPLILCIAYIVIYRKKMTENANLTKMRTKKASKVAVKRLKVAKQMMVEKKSNEFYDEILKTLWGYVSDKLSIPVSKLSKDNIEARLTERGVEESLIKDFETVLSEAEFARYAPGNPGETMDKVYSMAMNVITKLEDSIKR